MYMFCIGGRGGRGRRGEGVWGGIIQRRGEWRRGGWWRWRRWCEISRNMENKELSHFCVYLDVEVVMRKMLLLFFVQNEDEEDEEAEDKENKSESSSSGSSSEDSSDSDSEWRQAWAERAHRLPQTLWTEPWGRALGLQCTPPATRGIPLHHHVHSHLSFAFEPPTPHLTPTPLYPAWPSLPNDCV